MIKIHGACHCGNIAFEADLNVDNVGICHCTDCQTLSASAFRTLAIVKSEDFRLIKGRPQEYVKTGDSGNTRIQAFCANCGSGIYATNGVGPPVSFNIRVGTLAQRASLEPRFECWSHSRLPWVEPLENTLKSEGNPQ